MKADEWSELAIKPQHPTVAHEGNMMCDRVYGATRESGPVISRRQNAGTTDDRFLPLTKVRPNLLR